MIVYKNVMLLQDAVELDRECVLYRVEQILKHINGGGKIRAFSSFAKREWELEYRLGETTFPEIGKIWVSTQAIDAYDRNTIMYGYSPEEGMEKIVDSDLGAPTTETDLWDGFWKGSPNAFCDFTIRANDRHLWAPSFKPQGILVKQFPSKFDPPRWDKVEKVEIKFDNGYSLFDITKAITAP